MGHGTSHPQSEFLGGRDKRTCCEGKASLHYRVRPCYKQMIHSDGHGGGGLFMCVREKEVGDVKSSDSKVKFHGKNHENKCV